jgi:hypothetical protein
VATKPKLTEKQYKFLVNLYTRQGKTITPQVQHWLENLPAVEASKLIDKWMNH